MSRNSSFTRRFIAGIYKLRRESFDIWLREKDNSIKLMEHKTVMSELKGERQVLDIQIKTPVR
jgi:hypothetical protein